MSPGLAHTLERINAIRAGLHRLGSPGDRAARQVAAPRFDELLAGAMSAPASSPSASGRDAGRYDELIREAARRCGLSADLIHAVVRAESDYDPHCTSSAGAMGLMQLMPATARALGVVDAYDPTQNLLGGCRYLRAQFDRFGDLSLALAAYNAGPGAVARYGGIPPYHETRAYVRRVLSYLSERTGEAR